MSEKKFTPGPWNVAGFDSRINEERYFGIGTPRGQMIVESFGECDSNRKANAALIAAAPEMYYALKHYFGLIQRADYGDIVAEQKIFEDICYIEGALQKAEGEE